ncbi:uncharacterized protein BDV14DRAFT_184971 [Aspergillus stella-maris]|uniref:uncharacterized protein n=1 Tax=Aspergillus stella-maris TaxID=1810926 RepID=UPI003CCD806B
MRPDIQIVSSGFSSSCSSFALFSSKSWIIPSCPCVAAICRGAMCPTNWPERVGVPMGSAPWDSKNRAASS